MNEDATRVLFVVFFVGEEGWHDRKWKSDARLDAEDGSGAYYKLISEDLTLSIAASSDGQTIEVQGESFAIAQANVLIADVRGEGGVEPLGVFEMPGPSDEPAVMVLLRESPEILASLEKALSEPPTN